MRWTRAVIPAAHRIFRPTAAQALAEMMRRRSAWAGSSRYRNAWQGYTSNVMADEPSTPWQLQMPIALPSVVEGAPAPEALAPAAAPAAEAIAPAVAPVTEAMAPISRASPTELSPAALSPAEMPPAPAHSAPPGPAAHLAPSSRPASAPPQLEKLALPRAVPPPLTKADEVGRLRAQRAMHARRPSPMSRPAQFSRDTENRHSARNEAGVQLVKPQRGSGDAGATSSLTTRTQPMPAGIAWSGGYGPGGGGVKVHGHRALGPSYQPFAPPVGTHSWCALPMPPPAPYSYTPPMEAPAPLAAPAPAPAPASAPQVAVLGPVAAAWPAAGDTHPAIVSGHIFPSRRSVVSAASRMPFQAGPQPHHAVDHHQSHQPHQPLAPVGPSEAQRRDHHHHYHHAHHLQRQQMQAHARGEYHTAGRLLPMW